MEEHKTKRPFSRRLLNFLLKFIAVILLLFITIVLLVRSEWGQNIIVGKVTNYVSNKTGTEVNIEKLFITFDGDIELDGLYLEDIKGDTLVYSKSLEAGIPLWEALNGNIGIDNIEWEGLKANITRQDTIDGYNFQFLIDALVPADTTTTKQDKDSKLPNIAVGTVELKDFDVAFVDDVLGIDSHFNLGAFNLSMDVLDLNAMRYEVNDISLKNTSITFEQTKSISPTPDENESPKPYISIDHLELENVKSNFTSKPNNIKAKGEIGTLLLELPKADLVNNAIDVSFFELASSSFLLKIDDVDQLSSSTNDSPNFKWPIWAINADGLVFKDNDFSYFNNNKTVTPGTFNPDALVVTDFNFIAEDLQLQDKNASANIEQLNFLEASGIHVKKVNVDLKLTDKSATISNMDIAVNQNTINGQARASYSTLSRALENIESTQVNLNLPYVSVDVSDVFRFQPSLRQNQYLKALSKNMIQGRLNLNGTLGEIDITTAYFNWGKTTSVSLAGTIQNTTDVEALRLGIPSYTFKSTKSDLRYFIQNDSLSFDIPNTIELQGSLRGGLNDIATDSRLLTSSGDVLIKGSFQNTNTIAFNALVKTDSLQINKVLKNDQLSPLNLTLKAKGSGSTINTLNAQVDATIKQFDYANYTYDTIALQAKVKDGQGPVLLDYKDDNLNVKMDAVVTLDSVSPKVNASINLIGANLQALGITRRNIKTAFTLNANFEGNAEAFDIEALIEDGVSVYDNQSYLIGDIAAQAFVRPDTTSVKINNKMLDLELESNSNPTQTSNAITEHINSYLSAQQMPDSLKFVKLKVKGKITDAPVLKDVFLADLRQLDTVAIDVDFSAEKRQLIASIKAPYINYAENKLDSLNFNLNSTKDDLNFNLGLKSLNAGPIAIKRTVFDGEVSNDSLKLDFTAFNGNERLMHIQSELFKRGDSLGLHINPKDLVLNSQPWQIPQNNNIRYIDNVLDIDNFVLSRNNQSIAVTNKKPNLKKDHLGIDFNGFKLSSILNYLNPDKVLAKGSLNGELILEEPFGASGLVADLRVSHLNVLEVDLNTLTLDAKSEAGNKYKLDLNIKGGAVDLNLGGRYLANTSSAELDLKLAINEFKMMALEGFTQGEITEASGGFSGNIDISGTLIEPIYKGQINFDKAQFKVAQLNNIFSLKNETLALDNDGIVFNSFTIDDESGNSFVVDGDLITTDFTNPQFDLKFTANNFRALNSTKEDNDLYYGTAVFDLDASLTGDLILPKLDATVDVGSETNVTYIIPPSQVAIESRDGIVLFVNKDNPDAILTKTQEEESAIVTGFDISTTISVGKGATVNVIIDELTGDNLSIKGDGDLKFNIYPNGRTTLSGRYTASDGHYELSLYNLVKRRFEIRQGSTITWAGDPLDASLDATATYRVEASASALMASTTSGADISTKQRFRQELPFIVGLNVDGELTQPKLSFAINLPEDERGAIGGQVYGRLQQLNQQDNELNKQVFSLLVLNRFFPDAGSDGSSGGAARIARDNINQALSDQLNVYADKLLGDTGVELDFGVDSYTDYQGNSPTERTTLDVAAQKKFLDDRLVVRVGSEVGLQGSSTNDNDNTPLVGNVSIEYLLTQNGKYRLKGFRKNQFENVVDGQLIVSGIALIFAQEFNKFEELWSNLFSSRTGKETNSDSSTKQ